MRGLLICPDERPKVAQLRELAPLATFPLLGECLAECWLEHLAALGAKEVDVLAADRPHEVRARIGDGARWGLRVEVIPETRELNVAEARARYQQNSSANWLPTPNDIIVMDRLPGSEHEVLNSCAGWFSTIFEWLSHAASPLRVGMHELEPGIWVGLRTHIAPTAHIQPPCWFGQNVWIGPKAVVGPMTVLEDRVFVEGGATISHSIVGPETFVGKLAVLQDSIVWGNTVINWHADLTMEVAQPYMLCALRQRHAPLKRPNWAGRIAALGVMLLTWPAAAAVVCRSKLRGDCAWRKKNAVCPQRGEVPDLERRFTYYELAVVNRWLRRWPQLWNIVRGEFTWIGNRPLSPEDAGKLRDDFERLWLSAPVGLISLADAVPCPQAFTDDARAHASFYAATANWRIDNSILARALRTALLGTHPSAAWTPLPLSFRTGIVKERG